MASAAQMIANKANAQHSTGPKSAAGKATTARNAQKHGLASQSFVILPGQEAEFQNLESSLRNDFHPEGMFQDILFKQILHAAWNLERCRKAEAHLHAQSENANLDPLLSEEHAAKLRLIALYAGRAERSLFRAAKELRAVQTELCHRADAGIDDPGLSSLIDTQSLHRQAAQNKARLNQAALNEVRAFCEAPTPGQIDKVLGCEDDEEQTEPIALDELLRFKLARARQA